MYYLLRLWLFEVITLSAGMKKNLKSNSCEVWEPETVSCEYYSDCRSRSVRWSWECINVHHLKPVLTISCLWALSELSVRENRFSDSIQSSPQIWWKCKLVIEWDLSGECGSWEWDVIHNEGEQVHRVLEKAPPSLPAFSCFLTLGELTRTVWLGDIECTLDTWHIEHESSLPTDCHLILLQIYS